MDPELQRLVDENDVRKLVIAFSIAMDARDEPAFRAAFADEVELDIPSLGPGMLPFQGSVPGDAYAKDVIGLLNGWAATQHVSTNHLVAVSGDRATCTCYTLATHYLPVEGDEPWQTLGARYDLEARRVPGQGWRFDRFRWTEQWGSGNRELWGIVQAGKDRVGK